MKNILIVFLLTISFFGFSQQRESKWQFTLGYGLGIIETEKVDLDDKSGYGYGDSRDFQTTGPLYVKANYRVFYNLSLGINYAYASYTINSENSYYNYYPTYYISTIYVKEVYESYSILLRMNYYFNSYYAESKFDPYAGLGVGIRRFKLVDSSFKDPISNPGYPVYYYPYVHDEQKFGVDFTLGANYYFTELFSVYLEAGLAKSVIQGGIAFSF